MELPNLSALRGNPRTGDNASIPLPPTSSSNEDFFYIMHRPFDSPDPNPEGVRRIIDSGGVSPAKDRFFNTQTNMNFDSDVINQSIASFFKKHWSSTRGADTSNMKQLVAWYYLEQYNGDKILKYANDDELVFRVPIEWLKLNVLSCTEYTPVSTEERRKTDLFLPFAFLTALVVPLRYRITDPSPLTDEDSRVLGAKQIQDFIYSSHVQAAPLSRSSAYYQHLEEEMKKKEEEEEAERQRRLKDEKHLNDSDDSDDDSDDEIPNPF